MDRRTFLALSVLSVLFTNKGSDMVWSNQQATTVILPDGVGFLVYNGTPAANNLILAIAATSGVDPYGNTYEPGLTLPGFTQGAADQGGITFPDNLSTTASPAELVEINISNLPSLNLRGPFPKTGGAESSEIVLGYSGSGTTEITIEADQMVLDSGQFTGIYSEGNILSKFQTTFEVSQNTHVNQPLIYATDPTLYLVPDAQSYGQLQIGSGLPGGYYYEEIVPSAQTITNNALLILENFTSRELLSDYGSAWNLATGLWTCPVSSVYDFTMSIRYNGWVIGSNTEGFLLKNGATNPIIYAAPSNSAGAFTISGSQYMNAGDTIQAKVLQGSGATQTINTGESYISIGRRL